MKLWQLQSSFSFNQSASKILTCLILSKEETQFSSVTETSVAAFFSSPFCNTAQKAQKYTLKEIVIVRSQQLEGHQKKEKFRHQIRSSKSVRGGEWCEQNYYLFCIYFCDILQAKHMSRAVYRVLAGWKKWSSKLMDQNQRHHFLPFLLIFIVKTWCHPAATSEAEKIRQIMTTDQSRLTDAGVLAKWDVKLWRRQPWAEPGASGGINTLTRCQSRSQIRIHLHSRFSTCLWQQAVEVLKSTEMAE